MSQSSLLNFHGVGSGHTFWRRPCSGSPPGRQQVRVAPHFHGDTHLVDARKGKFGWRLKDAPKFPFGSDARLADGIVVAPSNGLWRSITGLDKWT